jgi:YebC/PmpR family DNA-binding regulatory protein
MSGHSKWATIKRKKGAIDAKRSKVFTRIVKEIQIAVKEGGNADLNSNPRLRLAVQNAKGANMPKDNIERAIKKASGADAESYVETTFEGYANGGVAVFIECLTDNNNRTVGNIRAIFNKRGGNLGTNGSLSFIFERKGIFSIPKTNNINIDDLELEMIEAGAESLDTEGDYIEITTAMEDFGGVQKKLDELGIVPESAKLERVANDTKTLPVNEALKVMKMIEEFEEDDDVQNVYHNLEMTDELAAAMPE